MTRVAADRSASQTNPSTLQTAFVGRRTDPYRRLGNRNATPADLGRYPCDLSMRLHDLGARRVDRSACAIDSEARRIDPLVRATDPNEG